MRDWEDKLRAAYFGALAGITISGNPVEVYQEQVPSDVIGSSYYIVIGRVFSESASTFDRFGGNVFVEVEAIGLYGGNIGGEVDNLIDQVKTKLTSAPGSHNLGTITGFNVSAFRWENDIPIPVIQAASGDYIKRKISRFGQKIVDNN